MTPALPTLLARPRRSPTSGATTTWRRAAPSPGWRRPSGREHGGIVERVEVRGDRNQAGIQIGQLQQLVTTQSMFGGGSLAVVTNAGALAVRNEDRAGLLALLPLVAPGSGVVFVEASPSGAREPGQKRLVDGVKAAGGEIRGFKAPKAGELAGWIEAEARERGMRLGPGAARALATRIGAFVTDNDADRRNQTMIADRELDKLSLYRPDATVEPRTSGARRGGDPRLGLGVHRRGRPARRRPRVGVARPARRSDARAGAARCSPPPGP